MQSAKIRLYVDHPLGPGQTVPLTEAQAHYLFGVMRQGVGGAVLLFNGADGEWLAEVAETGKRKGVLVCGSGIGISIAANRNTAIRCALVHDVTGARLAREHNDANIIAFGARMTGAEVALDALRVFLETPFAGGRHVRRVAMLSPEWTET